MAFCGRLFVARKMLQVRSNSSLFFDDYFGSLNRNKFLFSPAYLPRFYCSNSGVPTPPPNQTYSAILDKFVMPVTVFATGALSAPGLKAMLMKPFYMWFYRRYYDANFDVKEFLVGARQALYFVAEKAFKRDLHALKDVFTQSALWDLRDMLRDERFRFYLNLHGNTTPILYESVGAAGFIDIYEDVFNKNEEDRIAEFYRRSVDAPEPLLGFDIFVFFVCQIERILSEDGANAAKESIEKKDGLMNFTRLLVMMRFSRSVERCREQTSEWRVSAFGLVPLQFTVHGKV